MLHLYSKYGNKTNKAHGFRWKICKNFRPSRDSVLRQFKGLGLRCGTNGDSLSKEGFIPSPFDSLFSQQSPRKEVKMSFAGMMDFMRKDASIPANAPKHLLRDLHVDFLTKYQKNEDGYEYVMGDYLRLSGIYWCINALDILGKIDVLPREDIINYVKSCQNSDGGFAPAPRHDSHLLHTLSAVQVLIILEAVDVIDHEQIAKYVVQLQNEDGSFKGDNSDEIDTRFSFCALATLHLLDSLNKCDVEKAAHFVLKCYNFDGGFGTRPESESHSGQVFCCVGALAIVGMVDSIDRDKTAGWLAMRQCESGGLNGRPDKLPDVCYSWWVLSGLAALRRLNWLDQEKLVKFIYGSQDEETGGFADRPGDYPDPFHTVFGLAGLSLFEKDNLEPIDPVFCMTKKRLKNKTVC